MESITGTILNLQRLSTEDGPGLRTTVFMKGCPLRCAWCHNPESISPRPQVQWLEQRCIGCKTCLAACPQHALTWTEQADGGAHRGGGTHLGGGAYRDRDVCQGCGACVEACPANAHEMLGKSISVEALVKELLKDRAYYEKSGGGVTLSGGEPSLQPAFALELLRALRGWGVSTALDTCGLCKREVLQSLVDESDCILFDLKLVDAEAHRRWTGVENAAILANLEWLGAYIDGQPEKRLWVRTPLIPGATLSRENITAAGAWLAERLAGRVERWELCAFNNLCRDKYRRLGLDWAFNGAGRLAQDDLELAGEWARASGVDPDRVYLSGAAT